MKFEKWQPYIFMSPFAVLTLLFYIVPALLTVVFAFTNLNSSFQIEFIGLGNFERIAKDPNTATIIRNTVLFVLITIVATIVIDLFLAVLTTYFIKSERWGSLFKAIWMIPMITPAVVYSVLWIWLLDASENGLLNRLYTSATHQEPVNWIASHPFPVIIIATLMTSIAFGTIIFSSAIKSIPAEQLRAAEVDGAGDWEIIKSIIIPNLKWPISFLIMWEALGLLTDYVIILLITNGGPGVATEVWALSAYHKAFIDMRYGYGAAISLVLIVVVMLIIAVMTWLMNAGKKQSADPL